MEYNIETKKNIRVHEIHWEKRPIIHTPSYLVRVCKYSWKSVALCFGFYGAKVRVHMNF